MITFEFFFFLKFGLKGDLNKEKGRSLNFLNFFMSRIKLEIISNPPKLAFLEKYVKNKTKNSDK